MDLRQMQTSGTSRIQISRNLPLFLQYNNRNKLSANYLRQSQIALISADTAKCTWPESFSSLLKAMLMGDPCHGINPFEGFVHTAALRQDHPKQKVHAGGVGKSEGDGERSCSGTIIDKTNHPACDRHHRIARRAFHNCGRFLLPCLDDIAWLILHFGSWEPGQLSVAFHGPHLLVDRR
jgi:hypothetical protein